MKREPLDPNQNVVYHYGAVATLLKMVQTRSLWATSIKYLNDYSEFNFFMNAVSLSLPAFLKAHPDLTGYDPGDRGASVRFLDQPFTTSFASLRDSLTHWHSYCSEGNGVSIGFRARALKSARVAHPDGPEYKPMPFLTQFGRVVYLSGETDKKIPKLLEAVYADVKKAFPKEEVLRVLGLSLRDLFSIGVERRASMCKSHAFAGEHEYRLAFASSSALNALIRFRTVQSTLVPYTILSVPNQDGSFSRESAWNAIASVTIGPSANMHLTRESLQAFFEQNRMEVDVRLSDVPYRDW